MALVDCESALLSLLDDISCLAVDPPSLYLDLEGLRFGRYGSISIVTLFVRPKKQTYLIDVHLLGSAAFSITTSNAVSLKSILESPEIPKVVFDIRDYSHALFSHHQICVKGIKDLQLMELATWKGSKNLVTDLARCLESDVLTTAAAKANWHRTKCRGMQLYNPKKDGRYEIFAERPLRSEVRDYCAGDVGLLPVLFDIYNARLRPGGNGGAFWRVQVREETTNRIRASQHPDYGPGAKSRICLAWDKWNIEQAKEAWNEEVLSNAFTGDMVLNKDDRWV